MKTHSPVILTLILTFTILFIPACSSTASDAETIIAGAVTTLINDLADQVDLASRTVFCGPLDFQDADTHISAPLALLLHQEAVTALRARRVVVALPGVEADLDAFSAVFAGGAAEGYWMLTGEWRVQGRHLGLTFKLLEVRGADSRLGAVANQRTLLKAIRPELLTPDLAAIGRALVHRLDQGAGMAAPLTADIHTTDVSGWLEPGELGEFLTRWLTDALTRSFFVRPAGRGRHHPAMVTSAAVIHPDHLEIQVTLHARADDRRLAAAAVQLPKSLLPPQLLTPPPLTEVADPQRILQRGYIQTVADSAPGQDEAMAKLAARMMAQARLLEIVDGLNLERAVTIRQGAVTADTIRMQLQGLVRHATVVLEEYRPADRSARVALRLYIDAADETGGMIYRALGGEGGAN